MTENIQAQAMHQSNVIRDSIKGLNAWVTEMKVKDAKRDKEIEPSFVSYMTTIIRNIDIHSWTICWKKCNSLPLFLFAIIGIW